MMLLAATPAGAQVTKSPLDAPYAGMGTYSLHFTDPFSGSVNEASLARADIPAAAVYAERRFLLKALSGYKAVMAIPAKVGGFGFSLDYFGSALFSVSQVGMGYGKKLNDALDIGIQINYNNMQLLGYGSAGTITASAGAIWHITPALQTGIHIYNPVGGKIGNEKLASVYTWGIGYETSDKFFIAGSITKEEDQPVNVNIGIQYLYARHFFAGAGISSANNGYFAGLGIGWKTYRLDMVTNYHLQLGFTPALMIEFDFKEKTKKEEE